MIPVDSKLEDKVFSLQTLEENLKPLGFDIGGSWEYDKGLFDYKLTGEEGYQFLRLPFKAEEGMLDVPGVTVRLDKPFILSHQYEDGLDDHASNGTVRGAFDQFQKPKDPDAEVPEKYVEEGEQLVERLEDLLL